MKEFKYFSSFCEMAVPTKEHRERIWYHGCDEKSIADKLASKVLKPGNMADQRALKMFTPLYNRVYLTPTIEFALVYSFSCNLSCSSPRSKEAYLCVVTGQNLTDIVPDEDIIADILWLIDYNASNQPTTVNSKRLDKFAIEKNLSQEEAKFLLFLLRYIIDNTTKTQHKRMNDYGHGTKIGKQLIKKMSDSLKIDIINKTAGHKSIAVEGEIPIHEIWKLDSSRYTEIKENPNDFKKYSKKIFGE